MKAQNHSRFPANSGIALVIVLAFVVLMTVLAVATFSRSTTNRQVANSDANSTRADMLALGSLDVIVSDLKQEIVNGSTVSTVNNNTIYVPSSAARMMPLRSGNPAGAPDPIPNLVRRSVRSDPILAPPGVASRASAINSTIDSSLNGRSIATARWNSHYLIPRANTYTTIDSTPTGSFVSPDWVLVTRGGPAVQTAIGSGSAALNNSNASNSNYVIGRYCYAVYDEGGLIDANVAGYPSPTPSPAPASYVQSIGRKGTVAFADLTQLASLAQGQIDNIAGWRNYASVRSIDSTQPAGSLIQNFTFNASGALAYSAYVKARADGFLRVSNQPTAGSTDQSFPTRQSLLQFRRLTGFTQNALQYLGTFSRELNRPTWSPSTPAGSTINYAGQAETSTSINRDLATVRITGTFTRADGTRAVVGEPLLKTRFPLTRIATLQNAVLAQRDFGLTWDGANNRWNYSHGSATRILRLDEVAAAGREPDFFELLKAVILSGSVGLGSGSAIPQPAPTPTPTFVASEKKYYDTTNGSSSDYQIMQIGANIIDSWDSDNIPTFINFAGNELAGVENLPYLNKLVFTPFFKTPGSVDYFKAWLVPSLFNPHQNSASATGTIRVALTGAAVWTATGKGNNDTIVTTCTPITPLPATMDVSVANFSLPTPQKSTPSAYTAATVSTVGNPEGFWGFQYPFTLSTPNASAIDQKNGSSAYPDFGTGGTNVELQVNFAPACPPTPTPSPTPTPLPGGPLITTQPADQTVAPGQTATFNVVATGNAPLSYQWTKNSTNIAGATTSSYTTPPATLSDNCSLFAVVVTNSVGAVTSNQATLRVTSFWKTYQTWKIAPTVGSTVQLKGVKQSLFNSNKLQDPEFVALDPRTVRFGVWASDAFDTSNNKKDYTDGADDSMDQSKASLEEIIQLLPQGSNFVTTDGKEAAYLYSVNSSGGKDYYKDLDGVTRQGDWTTGNGTQHGSTVMYGSNSADRPQILSAPFQSVAELGQIFRDQPWKTLAFTISNSGDAGLLDAFSLQDVPMIAGRTSLNTRQAPVLTAILSQAVRRLVGTNAISSTDISTVVNRLLAITAANPMISKSELVTKLLADASLNTIWNTSTTTNPWNKEARECVVRAFSDACQTRTWNLMIDVIAQSGRYPPNATGLANFVVEGEKRYWLHVAIDRFTGEIIDQQLEAVYE